MEEQLSRKEAKSRLMKAAIEYEELKTQIEHTEKRLGELREKMIGYLGTLGVNSVDVPFTEDYSIRVLLTESSSTSYDTPTLVRKLKERLDKKEVRRLLMKISDIVINPKKLESAYNMGLIEFDEVRAAARTRVSRVFRVMKVKNR